MAALQLAGEPACGVAERRRGSIPLPKIYLKKRDTRFGHLL